MLENVLLGGLEAGGTKMVCAIGRPDGTIVETAKFPTTVPKETVKLCGEWFAARGITALGIGAFGPTCVDPASPRFGRILETPKLAWRYFDLLDAMRAYTPVAIGYDTDVNVACLGEATFGCARGLDDVVYLTIGTGVGAGIMVSGTLLHGMLHPEAGHILIARDPSDPLPAGESGCAYHANCLEGLIAGPAIAKRWDGKRASDIAGDHEAMELLAGYLAQALVNYILCYSPEKIIIGGGVADNTPIIPLARARARELLNGYIVAPELEDWNTYIVPNSLDGTQGILGCFELARRALEGEA